jgi:glycosylphosphatidylinositol transamidase (GPIT) subunit GPI8
MYQRLKKYGYDDDHIVLIAENDIAYNIHNKEPGILRTSPNGENVYDSSAIDYSLSELSAIDLGNILKGNKSSRLPQVMGASSEDNIIIYWSSHGTQGNLEFGNTEIAYGQMAEILKDTPHRKMMFVL